MQSRNSLIFTLCIIVGCSIPGCKGESDKAVQIHSINYSKTSSVQVLQESEIKSEWARWRGPNGNGIAPSGQTPVTKWDSETNILWKTKVSGRGHASPTVLGNKIFLATADKSAGTQSVLCFDRETGEPLWTKQVNKGGLRKTIHRNNSYASSTISSDGESLFVVMENNGNVVLYALDFDGETLWNKTVAPYQPHFGFGFGASPLVHKGKVYVAAESKEGALVAYDCKTGDELWRIDRNSTSSYTSPIITTIDNKNMLLISGGKKVQALDPDSGKEIWEAKADWQVTCGTMVWDGNMVFASGGFPDQQTVAVNAGTGEVVWENGVKCYEQSLLAFDGYIYAVNDRSVAYCWRAKDGEEMWKNRLGSGGVSASPILANGNIYASVEAGTTFVFKANPEKFELVAENKLGDSAFATPSIVGSKIYARVGARGQEWLYCIGQD